MKRHSIIFGLFLLVLTTQFAWSQPTNTAIGDVVMPTPNAASLGKYTDVPVSYFTGVPSNSIPIYTVSDGKVSLPISLSYHSSGIKVAEMASWVGTGWNLSAGGMITRTILDRADDGPLGYYQNGHLLDLGDIGLEAIVGVRDGEPDLFNFSLPNGISGRFYFTGDGPGMVEFIPKQDLKLVEETFNGGTFIGFTIITPDGTKYIFGKDNIDNRTAQERMNNQSDVERISSWYLLRIQSFDGIDNITLDYQTESYDYNTPSSCRIYYTGCDGGGNGAYESWSAGQDCTGTAYNTGHYYTTTHVTQGMRLSSITSPTETVNFSANTVREDLFGNAHRLDAISIESGTEFCKQFNKNEFYFDAI